MAGRGRRNMNNILREESMELCDSIIFNVLSPQMYDLFQSLDFGNSGGEASEDTSIGETATSPEEKAASPDKNGKGVATSLEEKGKGAATLPAEKEAKRSTEELLEAKRESQLSEKDKIEQDAEASRVFVVRSSGFVTQFGVEVVDELVELYDEEKKDDSLAQLTKSVRKLIKKRNKAASSKPTPAPSPAGEDKEKPTSLEPTPAHSVTTVGEENLEEGEISSDRTISLVFPSKPVPEEEEQATLSEPTPATEQTQSSKTHPPYIVHWKQREITGNFTYTIEGKLKDGLYYGRTSRSKTLKEQKAENVTIIPINSLDSASKLRDALVTFEKSRSVVNLVYLNERIVMEGNLESHVVIERIDRDMQMLIDDLSVLKHWRAKDWSFYKVSFNRSFRGVAVGFSKVFLEGNYHVRKLLKVGTLSVDSEDKSKLANFVKKKDSSTNRIEEMENFGDTMITFLTKNDIGNEDVAFEERLKNLSVPDNVINYIGECRFLTFQSIDRLRWMLDFSGFWDVKTIRKWVYMASGVTWKWVLDLKFSSYLDILLKKKLKHKDWETFIPESGRFRQVYDGYPTSGTTSDTSKSSRNIDTSSSNSRTSDPGHKFNGLIRYCRNVFEHFDKLFLPKHKWGDELIYKRLESFFGNNLINILRETLHDALFLATPPKGVDWSDMLTRDMI